MYEQWSLIAYTIAYKANNGTGTTANNSHVYGTAKTLTANGFARTGYTFLGWSTSNTATTATYTNAQSVSNLTSANGSTITLYAVWAFALKPGDFVNYTAGNWTATEINSLTALNLYLSDTSATSYKFGGFKAGTSKNATLTLYSDSVNIYSSGWMVHNVKNGIITLMHAGSTESYYRGGRDNSAYMSQYVLSSGKYSTSFNNYSPRNWNMYVNSTYATSAYCMSLSEANIYTNLLKTGSEYWLSSPYDDYRSYYVDTNGVLKYNSIGRMGIRPMVTLKNTIKIVGGKGTQSDPYKLGI